MRNVSIITVITFFPSLVTGFAPKGPQAKTLTNCRQHASRTTRAVSSPLDIDDIDATLSDDDPRTEVTNSFDMDLALLIPATVLMTALPAEAAAGIIPSALWAYAHYFSILVITGCLVAERNLIKPDMNVEDEDTIVKIDVLYGLMAALLIISGFARAAKFGKGGDFYIHDILFWVKMTFSGIWGGLSIFPSLTFYKRNYKRTNDEEVPPLSDKLAARLQQVINAEISAILTIPFLATLMSRGVWYWQDFPFQIGLALSIAATGGSFYLYGKQALTWTEDDESDVVMVAKEE